MSSTVVSSWTTVSRSLGRSADLRRAFDQVWTLEKNGYGSNGECVGLDVKARTDILRHVRELVIEQGIGVLWATHLFDEIMPGDDLVVLHQGRVLAHGPIENILADAGARDINSAFMRLTGAAVEPGSPAP